MANSIDKSKCGEYIIETVTGSIYIVNITSPGKGTLQRFKENMTVAVDEIVKLSGKFTVRVGESILIPAKGIAKTAVIRFSSEVKTIRKV